MMKRQYFTGMGIVALMGLVGTTKAEDLQQPATHQDQIRGETRQLVTRLDDFAAEYTRNGIADGDDYETLKKVRGELGNLSEDEMEGRGAAAAAGYGRDAGGGANREGVCGREGHYGAPKGDPRGA